MIALAALVLLAGAPQPESLAQAETVGSVDGPFLWVDAHGSIDQIRVEAEQVTGAVPLADAFASERTVLVQGQFLAAGAFACSIDGSRSRRRSRRRAS